MKVQRSFTTKQGRAIEIVGPSNKAQIWIDGVLYMTTSGLRSARQIAIEHSIRHGMKR